MRCINCGNEIDSNSKFCKFCGARVETKTVAKVQIIDNITRGVLGEIEIIRKEPYTKVSMYKELSQGIVEYENIHNLKIRTSKNLTELHRALQNWVEITAKFIKSYSKYTGKDYIDSMGMYLQIEKNMYETMVAVFTRIRRDIGNNEELKDLLEQEKNQNIEKSLIEFKKRNFFLSVCGDILKKFVDCKTLMEYKLIEEEWVNIKKEYLKNIDTTLEIGFIESIYTYLNSLKYVIDLEKGMLIKLNKLLEQEIANYFKK